MIDGHPSDSNGLFVARPSAISTATRRQVEPLNATPDDITIEDIGHALARICRYGGHVGGYLSVARHSLWVTSRLDELGHPPEVQLLGLLHDAAEAYLGDLVRPLKHATGLGTVYLEAEARLEAVIAERFDLPYPHPPCIHDADNYVLLNLELGGPQHRWNWEGAPVWDERVFMQRYRQLAYVLEVRA